MLAAFPIRIGLLVSAEGGEAAGEGAGHIPELPNLFVVLADLGILNLDRSTQLDVSFIFYSFLVMVTILAIIALAKRGMSERPTSRLYILTEMFLGGIRDFFGGVLGKGEVKRHIWLIGTLFVYILFMNLSGLVPLGFAPSANFGMNIAMGLVVFLYVLYVGISRNGILKWLHHMIGSPNDPITWAMTPLFLFIHLLEEVIRPISLSLRLFGNILGKDILLGVFIGLVTIPVIGWFKVMVPLHWPFLFLAVLLSVIQALIFSMLTSVYILLVLPHKEPQQAG